MKKRFVSSLVAGACLLTPLTTVTSHAQDVPADQAAPAQTKAKDRVGFPISDTAKSKLPVSVKEKTTKAAREALDKIKIDLELKGAEADGAFQTLMKQIGADFDIDPAFYPFGQSELDLPERALTMKLTKASAARVLDSFCDTLGIGWWAEKSDERVMIHLVKLQSTVGKLDMLAQMGINVPALAAQAAQFANLEAVFGGLDGGLLPDTRVKAEATSPREVKLLIEELCKQAGLVFAIDSDVPSTSKTLAFENVPIKTALETLCATANLSMSVSRKGEKTVVTFSKAEAHKE